MKNIEQLAKKKGVSKKKGTFPPQFMDFPLEFVEEKKIEFGAIVKIFCSITEQSYISPWKMNDSVEVSGSGFVIDAKRILTNAHVVRNATFITILPHGSSKKYTATIAGIGHDCDLAVLKVNDPAFWKEVSTPFKFGKTPKLEDNVSVIGYPEGGNTISITKGIVSRIEESQYSLSLDLLIVQIDAPINPGNSGGPVLNDVGEVVGIAFQKLNGSDNIGYIIPSIIVQHFLGIIEREGRYNGFATLGIQQQSIESPYLAEFLKLKEPSGVLVTKVSKLHESPLEEGDIILELDGKKLSGDGSVVWRGNDLIGYGHFISLKYNGDSVKLKISRKGEIKDVEAKVKTIPHQVPTTHDAYPHYYICGGLVFVTLTAPFFEEFATSNVGNVPLSLEKFLLSDDYCEYENQQIVVLSRILKDEVNFGYEGIEGLVLKKVNGTNIKNLVHVKELVEQIKDGFIDFEFEDKIHVALKSSVVKERDGAILKMHKIPQSSNFNEK